MPKKVIGNRSKTCYVFGSRISIGESRLVSTFIGKLHFKNYLQGCTAEIITELFKILITILRTFIRVFFFLDTVFFMMASLKVATPSL